MGYLIDTNVLSEIRKADRCDGQVAAWWGTVDEDTLFLSVLTLGEVRSGIERLRPRDAPAALRLEAWLDALPEVFRDRILPVTMPIAQRWGHLEAQRPLSKIDGLLAATALEHDLVLVTRNIADVSGTGVQVLNPFRPVEP